MYRIRPRKHYEGYDEYGDPCITANEVIELEPEETWTGLLDQFGDEIHKEPERVKLGFHLGGKPV